MPLCSFQILCHKFHPFQKFVVGTTVVYFCSLRNVRTHSLAGMWFMSAAWYVVAETLRRTNAFSKKIKCSYVI